MDSIQGKIQAAAPRNQELLQILAETDHAKPSLEQQRRSIADLQNELSQLDRRIKDLETSRVKELKEHEKYRDSVMKRFAYKVGRKQEKFNVKAEKEEREYFEVLQEEHKAKEMRRNLGNTLDQAQRYRAELEVVVGHHDQAQRNLDQLYDSIFEGPTPGFPDEDAKERAANDTLNQYHNMRVQAESEAQVLQNLDNAIKRLNLARYNLAEARSMSQMDMFGGGAMTDMMERSALSKAGIALSEAKMMVDPCCNLMSDVFFDNIFTDMAFHEKIKNSQLQHDVAQRDTEAQRTAAEQRYRTLNQQLKHQAQGLESARAGLQQVRTEAFQRLGATQ